MSYHRLPLVLRAASCVPMPTPEALALAPLAGGALPRLYLFPTGAAYHASCLCAEAASLAPEPRRRRILALAERLAAVSVCRLLFPGQLGRRRGLHACAGARDPLHKSGLTRLVDAWRPGLSPRPGFCVTSPGPQVPVGAATAPARGADPATPVAELRRALAEVAAREDPRAGEESVTALLRKPFVGADEEAELRSWEL